MQPHKSKELENNHHFQMYARYPITIQSGRGTKVFDENGKEYLDALGGIAVNGLGHCHPKVVEAIREQAGSLIHCSNLYYNKPQSLLAEKLTYLSGTDRVFFCNSGAEAVEGALKLVKKYAHKHDRNGSIFSFENCFHGRTIATIAMGKSKYQKGFGPMPDGFEKLEFNNIEMLHEKIQDDTIAVIIEPIQGEGGIIPAKKKFLEELRSVCDKTDTLLIFDEIQCGIGRSGHFLAYQHFNVKPDIITIAKSLGGGMPIGAVLTTDEIARAFEPGDHGTTFGGNPLACAAALATLDTIEEENLLNSAGEKGSYFISKILENSKEISEIKNVRGIGLMIGIELDFKCADVVKTMMEKGILANCAAEYVIRFLPPLTISYREIDKIIEVTVESIKEVR